MALGTAAAPSATGPPNVNKIMMQNLQSLIAANPSFLTSGIPNELLTKMFNSTSAGGGVGGNNGGGGGPPPLRINVPLQISGPMSESLMKVKKIDLSVRFL